MILNYKLNEFQGAVISSDTLQNDIEQFKNGLEETLKELKSKDVQVVWFNIPIEKSEYIPLVVDYGFTFHHTDDNGLLLTLKLVDDAYVPGYATHYIGAGGVVLDSDNRLLVIQEKYHNKKHYKLPGGALDPLEHISDAVIREVFEETGIRTEFISLSSFRHFHGYRYGKSDIYFVCRLKPLSSQIKIDPREISKAIWMPVEEYLADPETRPFNRKIVGEALKGDGLKIETIPGYGDPIQYEMMF